MKAIIVAGAVMALACAANASFIGGLVIGSADPTDPVLFLEPGQAPVPLFGNQGVWGMGADNPNGLLYLSESDRLYSWSTSNFDTLPVTTAPTLLANMTQQGGGALRPAGLTFANGSLYGSEVNSGLGNTGSIFEIDTTTGVGTPVFTYDAKLFKLDGMAFDEASQLFYFLDNDPSANSGLWSIDIFNAGAPVHVADFPASQATTLSAGLAINKGLAYMVPGRAGPSVAPIAVWDIAAGAFLPEMVNPMDESLKQAGAAWLVIPTPGSMAIIAMGGMVALRRRRAA